MAALSGLFMHKDAGSVTAEEVGDAYRRELSTLSLTKLRDRVQDAA